MLIAGGSLQVLVKAVQGLVRLGQFGGDLPRESRNLTDAISWVNFGVGDIRRAASPECSFVFLSSPSSFFFCASRVRVRVSVLFCFFCGWTVLIGESRAVNGNQLPLPVGVLNSTAIGAGALSASLFLFCGVPSHDRSQDASPPSPSSPLAPRPPGTNRSRLLERMQKPDPRMLHVMERYGMHLPFGLDHDSYHDADVLSSHAFLRWWCSLVCQFVSTTVCVRLTGPLDCYPFATSLARAHEECPSPGGVCTLESFQDSLDEATGIVEDGSMSVFLKNMASVSLSPFHFISFCLFVCLFFLSSSCYSVLPKKMNPLSLAPLRWRAAWSAQPQRSSPWGFS